MDGRQRKCGSLRRRNKKSANRLAGRKAEARRKYMNIFIMKGKEKYVNGKFETRRDAEDKN